MATQKVRQFDDVTLTYEAGKTKREKLAKGLLLRELNLVLSGTLTASASLTKATLKPGAAFGLIKNIRIMAGSTETLYEATGEQLRYELYRIYGVNHVPTFTLGAAAGAFALAFKLPFWKLKTYDPLSWSLWTAGYSDVYVEVDFGTPTDIDTNATALTASLAIGQTASDGYVGSIYQSRIWKYSTSNITGAQDFSIPLPIQGPAYYAFLLSCKAADGTDLGGKIDRLMLKSGPTELRNIDARIIRNAELQSRGSPIALDASGNALPVFQDAQFNADAWYYWDLCADGYLTEAEPTLTKAQLNLIVRANAAIPNLYLRAYQIFPGTSFELK